MIDLYPRCVNVLDTSVETVFLPFEKWVRVICGNMMSLLFFVVSVKNQTIDLEVSGIITTFAF